MLIVLMDLNFFLGCIWYMMPAYFSNMAPVFVKNHFKFLAKPVDFNKRFGRKPVLGSHKTFRGIIFGVLSGVVVMMVQVILFSNVPFFGRISLFDYARINYSLLGFLLGFGALFGDMVKSFFKRRANIKPGGRWVPFDQLDYVIGALLFGAFVYSPPLYAVIVILVSSFLLHIAVNHLGYYFGIRKERW